MNRHPGGLENTGSMLELSGLPEGASVLDMGAGAGETVRWLRSRGYRARGIDLEPGDPSVEPGDLLHAPFRDGSFDAVISQCAFFVSGDAPGAIREAGRLVRPGGILMLSDLFTEEPRGLLEKAGFEILHMEDLTALWKEYYIEALWREDDVCRIPHIKCTYRMVIGRRETDGSH